MEDKYTYKDNDDKTRTLKTDIEETCTLSLEEVWTCEVHGETTLVLPFYVAGKVDFIVCYKCLVRILKDAGLKNLSSTIHTKEPE